VNQIALQGGLFAPSREEAASNDRILAELAQVALQVNYETAADVVLDTVTTKARQMLNARQAFASVTAGPGWIQRLAAASPWGRDVPERCDLAAISCETGRPLRRSSEQLRAHLSSCQAHSRAEQDATGGWLAVPLARQNGMNIGLLQVFGAEEREFDEGDQALLLQLAQLASGAIVRAQLLAEVRDYATSLEDRVAERTAELREINAGLEAFAYSVSHDLRVPLQAVFGFAGLLSEQCAPNLDPSARIYAGRIVSAAQRMDQLIKDLLEFSRTGRSEIWLEPVAISHIAEDAASHVAASSSASSAEIQVEASPLQILGHGPTLVQALVNLISNALKYVAPGVDPRVRIWAEERGGFVRLWIRDNGIGIPREEHERIFEPFQRLEPSPHRPGSGIGLSIVRRAVAACGGTVGVESEPGEGSAFWLDLPRASRNATVLIPSLEAPRPES
jgi:signal transduction histidine kinase